MSRLRDFPRDQAERDRRRIRRRGYRSRYSNGDEVGIVAIVYEAEIVAGKPTLGDDETQDVAWFTADELETLGLRPTSRATLATLGLVG